jgi:hypothetical protein
VAYAWALLLRPFIWIVGEWRWWRRASRRRFDMPPWYRALQPVGLAHSRS